MLKSKFKTSFILSIIIIVLAIIASAGGIFIQDLYQDNEFTKTAWFGNDLVTLFLAVPVMIMSLFFAMRDSKKAQLIWIGSLWYMVYNYMFYLYGAAFNIFFLIYTALFTLSTYGLILALINVDAKDMCQRFSDRTPIKWIAGYLMFFSVLLGGLWIAMSLGAAITGEVPIHITKTGHPTGVVFATDLSMLIPSAFLSGILLWKKQAWGYVLSAVVMVKCVAYSLVLIIMSAITSAKLGEGDPFIVLWYLLSGACIVALISLLSNMKGKVLNKNI